MADEKRTPYDVMEAVIVPALNTWDEVAEADYLTATEGGTEVMNVVLNDGSRWQITVAYDPIGSRRVRIGGQG